MFSAFNRYGTILAFDARQDDGPFHCPTCQAEVILKQGQIKVPHFAHLSSTNCSFSGQGESEEHRRAKQEIYRSLLRTPGVSEVEVERSLHGVRADISFVCKGTSVALEVQVSTLSPSEIERRTRLYMKENVAVLWMSPFSLKMFEDRYAPEDWERYLHPLYFGKAYYWVKDLKLQPVQFQPYMLPPSRYSNEKLSKRFVSLSLLPSVWITDLTTVWRQEWHGFPHAKLWCQAKERR